MHPVDKIIHEARPKSHNDPASQERDSQDQKISHFIAQSALLLAPPQPKNLPIHNVNPADEGVSPPLPILPPEAALIQLAQYGLLANIKDLLRIYYNKNWDNKDIDAAIEKAEINGHDATSAYLRTYFNRETPNSDCSIL